MLAITDAVVAKYGLDRSGVVAQSLSRDRRRALTGASTPCTPPLLQIYTARVITDYSSLYKYININKIIISHQMFLIYN